MTTPDLVPLLAMMETNGIEAILDAYDLAQETYGKLHAGTQCEDCRRATEMSKRARSQLASLKAALRAGRDAVTADDIVIYFQGRADFYSREAEKEEERGQLPSAAHFGDIADGYRKMEEEVRNAHGLIAALRTPPTPSAEKRSDGTERM